MSTESTETEVKEKELTDWPGWYRLSNGGNRQYRSPGGLIISNRRFTELALKYKGHTFIPESDILPKPKKSFFSQVGSMKTSMSSKPVSDTISVQDTDTPITLPDATPKETRRRAGRATAKEISDGLYLSLSILTSIVQFITKTPGIAMTEMEAKHIAIPAANLLEPTWINDKFGQFIAGSGDWQLLGYALWLYGERVAYRVKEVHFSGHESQVRGTASPNVSGNGHQPGGSGPVSHSWTSSGGATKTPPGIR